MNRFIITLALVASSVSMATTYTCDSSEGDLRAKLSFSDDAETGALILSNPKIGDGNKTIVAFEEAALNLDGQVQATGKVDFRESDRRRGELIGGTKLGVLKSISLTVYENEEGKLEGELKLSKRKGRPIYLDLSCQQK